MWGAILTPIVVFSTTYLLVFVLNLSWGGFLMAPAAVVAFGIMPFIWPIVTKILPCGSYGCLVLSVILGVPFFIVFYILLGALLGYLYGKFKNRNIV